MDVVALEEEEEEVEATNKTMIETEITKRTFNMAQTVKFQTMTTSAASKNP